MSHKCSIPLPESIYKDNPDYTSRFPPRIHKDAIISDNASIQCHIDLYGDDVGRRFGNNNAHAGNFTALTAPEAAPDRLALIAYIIEYAFLHDDDTDNAGDPRALHQENKTLLQALNPNGNDFSAFTGLSEAARRKAEVRAKIATELLRMDPVFGNWFLSYWKKFTESMHDIRSLHFPSLDDYLVFRVVDAAAIWTLSLIRWAQDVYLTPDEEREAGPISYLAYAALALTNDLFSYEKERVSYVKSDGKVPFVNAVFIIMQTRSISEAEAKAVVIQEIKVHEDMFDKKRGRYNASIGASPSITKWLDTLEWSMSGNFVWSLRTPRYWKNVGNPYREQFEKAEKSSFRVIKPIGHESVDREVNGFKSQCQRDSCPGNPASHIHGNHGLGYVKPKATLKDSVLLEPYVYISSLPSKNIRQTLLGAMNVWYKVPDQSLLNIQGIVNYLHNASLILDDIQDGASLRRGRPAAHKIYGISQAINSATFLMNEALRLVQTLSPDSVAIYSDELWNLHLGQGHDLHWTYHKKAPTEEEYLAMVDGKTGGLFRLISRLMRAKATVNRDLEIDSFMTLFGRFFQIRDDYQNLQSADYATKKGFYEDLDEGKYSFPLIQALHSASEQKDTTIQSIFQSRQNGQGLSKEMKKYAVEQVINRGGLRKTKTKLKSLYAEILNRLVHLEARAGDVENWSMRLIITKLAIEDTHDDARIGEMKGCSENVWQLNQERAWKGERVEKRPVNQVGVKTGTVDTDKDGHYLVDGGSPQEPEPRNKRRGCE